MMKILRCVQKPLDTKGRPDDLTECLDGQLQLPFQNSAESFPYQDLVCMCWPSVRTVTGVIPFRISKGKLESSGTLKSVQTVLPVRSDSCRILSQSVCSQILEGLEKLDLASGCCCPIVQTDVLA